jgi:hypothetical protein
MTILPAKEAHKKWRDHVLKHYLDFVPAEKESAIAKLIERANDGGCAFAVYDNVWEGEIYNGRPLAMSICTYLNAMGYNAEFSKSAVDPERINIQIRWDKPKENW